MGVDAALILVFALSAVGRGIRTSRFLSNTSGHKFESLVNEARVSRRVVADERESHLSGIRDSYALRRPEMSQRHYGAHQPKEPSIATQIPLQTGGPNKCNNVGKVLFPYTQAIRHNIQAFPICKCRGDQAVHCGNSVIALKEFNITELFQRAKQICPASTTLACRPRKIDQIDNAMLKSRGLSVGKRVFDGDFEGIVSNVLPTYTLLDGISLSQHVRVELESRQRRGGVQWATWLQSATACAVGDEVQSRFNKNRDGVITSLDAQGGVVVVKSTSVYVEAGSSVGKWVLFEKDKEYAKRARKEWEMLHPEGIEIREEPNLEATVLAVAILNVVRGQDLGDWVQVEYRDWDYELWTDAGISMLKKRSLWQYAGSPQKHDRVEPKAWLALREYIDFKSSKYVRRSSTPEIYKRTLLFKPGKMGIRCQPETGIVTRVTQTGAAHEKGVKLGARVVKVGNVPYSYSALKDAVSSGADYEVTFVEKKVHAGKTGFILKKNATAGRDVLQIKQFKFSELQTHHLALYDVVEARHVVSGARHTARIVDINPSDNRITVHWDGGDRPEWSRFTLSYSGAITPSGHHSSWNLFKFRSCQTGSVRLPLNDSPPSTRCDTHYRGRTTYCEDNPNEEDIINMEAIGKYHGMCLDGACYDKVSLSAWLQQSAELPHNRAHFAYKDLNQWKFFEG